MRTELINYQDNWTAARNAALNTVGKDTSKYYPSPEWKKRIIRAEHSPIRVLTFTIRLTDVPYWVSVHLTRHKIGVEHFVSTQRTDRTGIDRDNLPQDAPVSHTLVINAQALINISRKRLCYQASQETRETWMDILAVLINVEPEIVDACVPECVYRGFCPELHPCGFADTEEFQEILERYRA